MPQVFSDVFLYPVGSFCMSTALPGDLVISPSEWIPCQVILCPRACALIFNDHLSAARNQPLKGFSIGNCARNFWPLELYAPSFLWRLTVSSWFLFAWAWLRARILSLVHLSEPHMKYCCIAVLVLSYSMAIFQRRETNISMILVSKIVHATFGP